MTHPNPNPDAAQDRSAGFNSGWENGADFARDFSNRLALMALQPKAQRAPIDASGR
jgi:hypothetical protein